ncbi:MAG: flavodoxin family protein [bacterium]
MKIQGIYGSPRKGGNTDILLGELLGSARERGADIDEIYLRKLNMKPCLEIYGCKKDGRCVIRDDFDLVYDKLEAADAIVVASPIFFYTVSAHTKILIDRCQSFWVRKYLLNDPICAGRQPRRGVFIGVGASTGKKLFDGVLLTIKYFFNVLDVEIFDTLLVRGIDEKGGILGQPEIIEKARGIGKRLTED